VRAEQLYDRSSPGLSALGILRAGRDESSVHVPLYYNVHVVSLNTRIGLSCFFSVIF
jgi:hypothetical protein